MTKSKLFSENFAMQEDSRSVKKYRIYCFLVLLGFIALALIHRLPFYWDDSINWDEHTFLLMGSALLDGHLPYTKLWDLKPPVVFLSYAFFIKILGENIISVRFAGTLYAALTAFFAFLSARKIMHEQLAIAIGVFTVFLIGTMPYGQATMSETIAIVPLAAAFYLMVANEEFKCKQVFLVAFLLATAALIRLNLLYVSLTICCFLLIFYIREKLSIKNILFRFSAYTLGYSIPFLLILVPYIYIGEVQTLIGALFLAPLSYTEFYGRSSGYSIFPDRMLSLAKIAFSWGWIIPLMGIVFVLYMTVKRESSIYQNIRSLSLLFLLAIMLSILRGGAFQDHYLIQLSPFLGIILVQSAAKKIFFQRPIFSQPFSVLVALSIFIFPVTGLSMANYNSLISQTQLTKEFRKPSPAQQIADYLIAHRADHDLVYMMDDHIAYLYMDIYPPTACSTHPSNIVRKSILQYCSTHPNATPLSEMNNTLSLKPKFIVKKDGIPWYLKTKQGVHKSLMEELHQSYQLVEVIERREIYRRL